MLLKKSAVEGHSDVLERLFLALFVLFLLQAVPFALRSTVGLVLILSRVIGHRLRRL